MIELFLLILFSLSLLCIYILFNKKKKDRIKKETERMRLARLTDNVLRSYHLLSKAVSEYEQIFEGYVANYPYLAIRNKNIKLLETIPTEDFNQLFFDPAQSRLIAKFIDFQAKSENQISLHNKEFIEISLKTNKHFFNTTTGISLDIQQRHAILTDEDNNLVIAGAGSGKTTTVVGKVNYLVQKCGVNPARILLLSFTRKAVENLVDRISIPGLTARTFNSFGLEVLTESKHKQTIFQPDELPYVLKDIFESLIKDNTYLEKLTSFFVNDYKIEKNIFDFKNHGDYIQSLKDEDYQPFQIANTTKSKVSFDNTKVKSFEECKIANFLFLNNVEYIYELPYIHFSPTKEMRAYKPDFTIYSKGETIYLEHFNIVKLRHRSLVYSDL